MDGGESSPKIAERGGANKVGASPFSLWPQQERVMPLNVYSSLSLVADGRHDDRDWLETAI